MQATGFDEGDQQARQVSYGYDSAETTLWVTTLWVNGNGYAIYYCYSKAGCLDAMTYSGYSGPPPVFDGEG